MRNKDIFTVSMKLFIIWALIFGIEIWIGLLIHLHSNSVTLLFYVLCWLLSLLFSVFLVSKFFNKSKEIFDPKDNKEIVLCFVYITMGAGFLISCLSLFSGTPYGFVIFAFYFVLSIINYIPTDLFFKLYKKIHKIT
jgi:hypothetical protein